MSKPKKSTPKKAKPKKSVPAPAKGKSALELETAIRELATNLADAADEDEPFYLEGSDVCPGCAYRVSEALTRLLG